MDAPGYPSCFDRRRSVIDITQCLLVLQAAVMHAAVDQVLSETSTMLIVLSMYVHWLRSSFEENTHNPDRPVYLCALEAPISDMLCLHTDHYSTGWAWHNKACKG